jgi:hypothetical protein
LVSCQRQGDGLAWFLFFHLTIINDNVHICQASLIFYTLPCITTIVVTVRFATV